VRRGEIWELRCETTGWFLVCVLTGEQVEIDAQLIGDRQPGPLRSEECMSLLSRQKFVLQLRLGEGPVEDGLCIVRDPEASDSTV
jgi:hypothetical protein